MHYQVCWKYSCTLKISASCILSLQTTTLMHDFMDGHFTFHEFRRYVWKKNGFLPICLLCGNHLACWDLKCHCLYIYFLIAATSSISRGLRTVVNCTHAKNAASTIMCTSLVASAWEDRVQALCTRIQVSERQWTGIPRWQFSTSDGHPVTSTQACGRLRRQRWSSRWYVVQPGASIPIYQWRQMRHGHFLGGGGIN